MALRGTITRMCFVCVDWRKEMEHSLRLQHKGVLDVCNATALLDFYGRCGEVSLAERVFVSISERERGVMCVGAMVKCLLNDEQDARAISLYDALLKAFAFQATLRAHKASLSLHSPHVFYLLGRAGDVPRALRTMI